MKFWLNTERDKIYKQIKHEQFTTVDKLREVILALSYLREERERLIDEMKSLDDKSNSYFTLKELG